MDTEDFPTVPALPQLLKGTWGTPGYTYAHICVHNLIRAQTEQDLRPVNGVPYYQITGPKGSAVMALMYRGQRLQGAGTTSSRPVVLADPDIYQLTGINPNPDLIKDKETPGGKEIPSPQATPAPAQRQGQSGKGDARVQGGNPA